MQAIVVRSFGGPEVLVPEEVPSPHPGPGEVLVEVRAAGVNPVEVYQRSGQYASLPSLPYTPGTDAAGRVVEVGEGMDPSWVGRRVYTYSRRGGAYAQHMVVAAADCFPLPPGVSYAQGAAVGIPYATAYHALFRLGPWEPGQRVLVRGASGAVGLAAVQLGASAGLEVWGTASTPQGKKLVEAQGALGAFDHDDDARLLEATQGQGFDRVVEMLANAHLAQDLRLLAPGGTVVVVGSRGEVTVNPRDLMSRLGSVRGFTLLGLGQDQVRRLHRAVAAGLAFGTLRPVVGAEFPLPQAARAHVAVLESGHRGKVVLRVGPEDD